MGMEGSRLCLPSLPIVLILNQINQVNAHANFDSIKVSGFGSYDYLY
jgi:hypothetical protein